MSKNYECAECGKNFFFAGNGIAHHDDPENEIDHDADADHVPYAEEEQEFDEEYEDKKRLINDIMTRNPGLELSGEDIRDIMHDDL